MRIAFNPLGSFLRQLNVADLATSVHHNGELGAEEWTNGIGNVPSWTFWLARRGRIVFYRISRAAFHGHPQSIKPLNDVELPLPVHPVHLPDHGGRHFDANSSSVAGLAAFGIGGLLQIHAKFLAGAQLPPQLFRAVKRLSNVAQEKGGYGNWE
jgi:hypothetical protein